MSGDGDSFSRSTTISSPRLRVDRQIKNLPSTQTAHRQKVKNLFKCSSATRWPAAVKGSTAGANLWLANMNEPKVSLALGCFVIPWALIQVKQGQFGVNRKGLQLIDLRGSRNIDLTTLLSTALDAVIMNILLPVRGGSGIICAVIA